MSNSPLDNTLIEYKGSMLPARQVMLIKQRMKEIQQTENTASKIIEEVQQTENTTNIETISEEKVQEIMTDVVVEAKNAEIELLKSQYKEKF
ncbi:MAG TPA: hypothetical protein PK075_01240 [Chitinophagales bacterium]|nr:hypothetical protein [Chitinophagales bacterium]